MGHIPKQSALYIWRPETSELCGECAFLKKREDGKSGCAFFGSGAEVNPKQGSCGYWSHAHPKQFDIPWMGIFTPEELGYAENKYGFGCWRCEYHAFGKNDCSLVDKDSDGDNPGKIEPRACCSLWEEDKRRAAMTDEALQDALARGGYMPVRYRGGRS